MKITKLEHSGLIIEKDDRRIVFDPVEIVAELPEMSNVVAVILTHKHGDHFQPEALKKVLANNVTARIFAPEEMAADIPGVEAVRAGDKVEVEGFFLEFFGENHAAIVPGVYPCQNIGVVIDGTIVNPGDSLDYPEGVKMPKVLFVADVAPWIKICEAMSYIEVVKPEMVIPVHDAILSPFGKNIHDSWLGAACKEVNAELKALQVGESVEVEG